MDADPGSAVPLAERKLPFQNSLVHLAASYPTARRHVWKRDRGQEGLRAPPDLSLGSFFHVGEGDFSQQGFLEPCPCLLGEVSRSYAPT